MWPFIKSTNPENKPPEPKTQSNMNKLIIPATYKKLLKFAAAGGSVKLIGTVIGSLDDKNISAYLTHMEKTDPKVYKEWGLKTVPKPPVDDDDPTLDLGDDDDNPITPEPVPVKHVKALPATPVKEGFMLIDGKEYPAKFRLRGPDGMDTDLEVFSKNTTWGIIVRVPVPADRRTILLSSGEVEIDLLELKRDPSGKTTIKGKVYSNSRLITAAELDED